MKMVINPRSSNSSYTVLVSKGFLKEIHSFPSVKDKFIMEDSRM